MGGIAELEVVEVGTAVEAVGYKVVARAQTAETAPVDAMAGSFVGEGKQMALAFDLPYVPFAGLERLYQQQLRYQDLHIR